MTQSELITIPNFLVNSEMLVLFLSERIATFYLLLRGRRQGGYLRFQHTFSYPQFMWG